MTPNISLLKQSMDQALSAIKESKEEVRRIAEATQNEVERLEKELDQLQGDCLNAIERVEEITVASKRARERLLIVNRDVKRFSEHDMKEAYENAQRLQVELGQWQEREIQLRVRRDDVSRRLKALRITAGQAEVLAVKLQSVTHYLAPDLEVMSVTLEEARMQSVMGMQLLQSQEEERRALAERLHEQVMQRLATTSMKLQFLDARPNSPVTQRDVQGAINDVIGNLRQTVFDLRPPLLDDLGLVPTLKRYLQQWTKTTAIVAHLHLIGLETTLNALQKVTLFRIVQEALQNVAQHANAQAVDVTLTFGVDQLKVTIIDDGVGVAGTPWFEWFGAGKFGLITCKQRVEALGGEIDLLRHDPSGTFFSVQIPIFREAAQV